MDFSIISSEILRPVNIIFFSFGVFTALLAHSLKNYSKQEIVLQQNEVLLARFTKWAGFLAIILSFYLIVGAGGWAYEDMVYLVKHSIILSPDWVSEITIRNMQGNAMQCLYGECWNRTILCNGLSCYYAFPKNASDAPNGRLILPNSTNWSINGSKIVINEQKLPMKAEIR